jgi:hypothetical protein
LTLSVNLTNVIPDEWYSRNVSCTLNLMSTFLLHPAFYRFWFKTGDVIVVDTSCTLLKKTIWHLSEFSVFLTINSIVLTLSSPSVNSLKNTLYPDGWRDLAFRTSGNSFSRYVPATRNIMTTFILMYVLSWYISGTIIIQIMLAYPTC